MSKAADKAALEALHAALATAFATVLTDGVKEVDKEGEVVTLTPSPAMFGVIRQFLRDNKIEALPVVGSPMGKLVDALPFAGIPTPDGEDTAEPPAVQH